MFQCHQLRLLVLARAVFVTVLFGSAQSRVTFGWSTVGDTGLGEACGSCLLLGDLGVVPTAEGGQHVGGGGLARGVPVDVVGLEFGHLGASFTVPPDRGALVAVSV